MPECRGSTRPRCITQIAVPCAIAAVGLDFRDQRGCVGYPVGAPLNAELSDSVPAVAPRSSSTGRGPHARHSQRPAVATVTTVGLQCLSACGNINLADGGPPVVDLYVIGSSGTSPQRLCSRGYIVRWSDNYGQDFSTMRLGSIGNDQLAEVTAPDLASESIPGPLTTKGLGIDGRWTISFSLVRPERLDRGKRELHDHCGQLADG